jgi:hypothetical protein
MEEEISLGEGDNNSLQDEKPGPGNWKSGSASENVWVSAVSEGDSEKLKRAGKNNVRLAA